MKLALSPPQLGHLVSKAIATDPSLKAPPARHATKGCGGGWINAFRFPPSEAPARSEVGARARPPVAVQQQGRALIYINTLSKLDATFLRHKKRNVFLLRIQVAIVNHYI